MKLYVFIFVNLRNISNNISPCTIIYKLLKRFIGLYYSKLGLSYSIFNEYKQTYNSNKYTERYINEYEYYEF